MKLIFLTVLIITLDCAYSDVKPPIINGQFVSISNASWNTQHIHGYHFHTYFFQSSNHSKQQAIEFREQIREQISFGNLKDCIVANYTEGPLGPHPIGQFVTCCNHTALSRATSWFMQNHKNLTVLLHPLTRYEIIDHTERAMWLGQSMPLDISALNWEVSLWSCN